jgi:hypothetical protein
MNLAIAHLRTLTRLRTTLMLFLQEQLDLLNTEFGFEEERELLLPERIILSQPPNFKLSSQPFLPQVFIRTSNSSNPQSDLVGHEDDNLEISITVLLANGITSPTEDLGLRCSALTNLICSVLIDNSRVEGSQSTGLYNVRLVQSSTPSIEQWNDLLIARCNATIAGTVRYERTSSRTKIPDFPLEDTHEPLSEAPDIVLTNNSQ